MSKKIIIKTDEQSKFLRTEGMRKAIEFEERFMKDKKVGVYNGVLWVKGASLGTNGEWQIYAYHTKTAIVVDIRKTK